MPVSDLDEWLRPGATRDEVTLDVDDLTAAVVLRAGMVITPLDRRARLTVEAGGARAQHDADEPGPPPANWDRMRIGAIEWRMVEPLLRWDLTIDDPPAGLRAYLAFSGSAPCVEIPGGYEQVGAVSGQLQLADRLFSLRSTPARRTHTWDEVAPPPSSGPPTLPRS